MCPYIYGCITKKGYIDVCRQIMSDKAVHLCICGYLCVDYTCLIYMPTMPVLQAHNSTSMQTTKRYSEVPARQCAPEITFSLLRVPCSRSALCVKDLRFQTLIRSKTRSPFANCKPLVESEQFCH